MEGNPGEDAQSSAPSESFHTIPIYNIDASSDSDSDNSDRFQGAPNDDTAFGGGSSGGGGTPAEPQNLSIMSQRTPIQPPIRSYTVPVQHTHQRQNSDLAESVQTRPSIDEELLFEDDEESEEEVYDPGNNVLQLTARPTDVITLPKTPVLVASPGTTYETPNMVEVPDIRQRMETGGLRPLSLLSGSVIVGGNDSQTKSKSAIGGGRSRDIHGGKHSNSDISKKEYDSQSGAIDEKYRRRSKELDNYRDSSDLLPLTLGGGGGGSGNAGGLIFATNYAYLAAPFGRVISRNQIMSRVVWFSTLVFFNMIYAGYKLIHSPAATTKTKTSTTDNQIDDGKSDTLNFMFLVIIPVIFLVLYIILVTIWTYLDLRNKDFDPTFTVLYYSPLMLFSLFFKEKKRVDVSEFHEVNYGAQWWKFGTSRVREGLVMTLYSLLLMSFVLSDLISSAVGQPNAEVSEVFKDFVPISFMLVVFFMGFVLSIWGVVEAVVGGGILGSGEGRKRLVGVLPYAFKRKKSNNR